MVAMNDVSGKSLAEMSGDELKVWFDQRFDQKIREQEGSRTPRISIMVTKGTLDWAYPPFILASTAAALGWVGKLPCSLPFTG